MTATQTDAVLDTVDSLKKTGHTDSITVSRGNFECDRTRNGQPGVWVTGYKTAALDRAAFVTDGGKVEWVR